MFWKRVCVLIHHKFVIISGLLPENVSDTADFILRINDVFDVCNSSTRFDANPTKKALCKDNEVDRRKLLLDFSAWLGRWDVQVPSVTGFQLTVAGLLAVWDRFGGHPLEFLLTRRLNQDALENLFGVIRMSSGQNDLPDAVQFRMALRKAATNSLLLAPDSANCEADGDSVLSTLTSMARRTNDTCPKMRATVEHTGGEATEGMVETECPLDVADANNLTYVGGYLLRKGCQRHRCEKCESLLCKPESDVVYEREMLCALKSYTGVRDLDVGSLIKPTQAFHEAVVITYQVTQGMAPSLVCRSGIASQVMSAVMSAAQVKALEASLCEQNSLRDMLATFVRMQLHVLCKKLAAKQTHGSKSRRENRKALKVSCRV